MSLHRLDERGAFFFSKESGRADLPPEGFLGPETEVRSPFKLSDQDSGERASFSNLLEIQIFKGPKLKNSGLRDLTKPLRGRRGRFFLEIGYKKVL